MWPQHRHLVYAVGRNHTAFDAHTDDVTQLTLTIFILLLSLIFYNLRIYIRHDLFTHFIMILPSSMVHLGMHLSLQSVKLLMSPCVMDVDGDVD